MPFYVFPSTHYSLNPIWVANFETHVLHINKWGVFITLFHVFECALSHILRARVDGMKNTWFESPYSTYKFNLNLMHPEDIVEVCPSNPRAYTTPLHGQRVS